MVLHILFILFFSDIGHFGKVICFCLFGLVFLRGEVICNDDFFSNKKLWSRISIGRAWKQKFKYGMPPFLILMLALGRILDLMSATFKNIFQSFKFIGGGQLNICLQNSRFKSNPHTTA